MTLDEFFAELEKTPRKWAIQGRDINPQGLIRTIVKGVDHCPLSMVAAKRTGKNEGYSAYASGLILGLRKEQYRKIYYAADGIGEKRHRARLLRACGLESGSAR